MSDKNVISDTQASVAVEDTPPAAPPSPPSLHERAWATWCAIYGTHYFLILILGAILLADAYPPLGAKYLYPEVTASWIAVVFIFVLSGMGIRTEEFAKALQRLKFNFFVQAFNFFVVSGGVFGVARLMRAASMLPRSLTDGMVICACLPITVNMVMVLTKSAGGDEAGAVFNAAFGNMVGVFLSPILILNYLGVRGEIDLSRVFFKLGLLVVLPIGIGQLLQAFVAPVQQFVKRYKRHFKRAQEYCLVFIVYTVFCKTFLNGCAASVGDVVLMTALEFCLLAMAMALAWAALRALFPREPRLQVMGLFGCTHKTLSMGVPLIHAIYEDDPQVGLYTLPLLIWHPMQLVLGTAAAPRLAAYVERREGELQREDEQGRGVEERRALSLDEGEVDEKLSSYSDEGTALLNGAA